MAKYKVDCGSFGRGGKVFKRGDIVTCDDDLMKTFPNSFVKVMLEDTRPLDEVSEEVFTPTKGPDETLAEKEQNSPETDEDARDAVVPVKGEKAAKAKASAASGKAKGKASKDPRGRNVTTRFPHAQDEDFLVFRQGKGYFIYDLDDPDKALNTKMVNKAGVDKVVDEALEI